MAEKKKGQLHELLAIEGDLKGEKDKVRDEAIVTFGKKPGLFLGQLKKLEMLDASRVAEQGEERHALSETVPKKLSYLSKAFARYWDVKVQKESANQEARTDVEIDGTVMFTDLPVTFLLGMEEEMRQLRKVYDAIPTLQPGVDWKKDDTLGKDVYKAVHPVVKNKTEKTVEHKVLVPATPEHPAQITQWNEDKTVGKYTTHSWSGMVSPAEKSKMLGKLDKVLRAFKRARQRANTQETKKLQVGKLIFDYINKE